MKFNKSETKKADDEFKMEILEDLGTFYTRKGGWELKLRYISWNGNPPKYDIRPWKANEDGTEKFGKGMTMTGEELEALVKFANS